jgi:hypothetical protein
VDVAARGDGQDGRQRESLDQDASQVAGSTGAVTVAGITRTFDAAAVLTWRS